MGELGRCCRMKERTPHIHISDLICAIVFVYSSFPFASCYVADTSICILAINSIVQKSRISVWLVAGMLSMYVGLNRANVMLQSSGAVVEKGTCCWVLCES